MYICIVKLNTQWLAQLVRASAKAIPIVRIFGTVTHAEGREKGGRLQTPAWFESHTTDKKTAVSSIGRVQEMTNISMLQSGLSEHA